MTSGKSNINPVTPQALVEVCLSPALLDAYHVTDKIVVIIDVFRASSAICTALGYGLGSIIPVSSIDEALHYKSKGYVTAAERNGEVVPGFDFGNSPFAFQQDRLLNKDVVLTTSNCTKAIYRVQQVDAGPVIIGSFLNMTALCEKLVEMKQDIVLLCAGWKSHVSMEDTMCAGAIAQCLLEMGIQTTDDGAMMAMDMYDLAKDDMREYLNKSSHHQRLGHLNLHNDLEYCLQKDLWKAVPILKGHKLVSAE